MLFIDRWQEIFETMRRNKLRTALTSLAVGWGIFMLILLLAFGTALESGAKETMPGFGSNQIFVWGGRVSRPYKGMQPGRRVRYDTSDIAAIQIENSDPQGIALDNVRFDAVLQISQFSQDFSKFDGG